MEEQLKDILAKSPTDWTNEDHLLIAKANLTLGRARVKAIRDEVLNPQEATNG